MIYRAVIVDDESYIADSTAVLLRSDCPWDMEIQVFYDPREALESIRSQKTDIVITDIRMPEVDGLEMLRQVSEFWPMCQVILLTAHAQFEYVYQAVGRPSADHVLKQDGYEALLAAVNRAVERINTTPVVRHIQEADIPVQAWYPLGHGDKALIQEPLFTRLGQKYGKSNAQIILRWHIQAGNIVIPGSKNPDHIRDNFALFDFALTDEEMALVAAMDKQKRYYVSTPELLKGYAEMVPPVDEQI